MKNAFFIILCILAVLNCYAQSAKEYFDMGSQKKQSYPYDYKGAIADYTKSIQTDSLYADSYAWRGDAKKEYMGQQQTNDIWAGKWKGKELRDYNTQNALADYNKAIEIDPANGGYYNMRAGFQSYIGNYKEAISDFKEAISLGVEDNYMWYKYNDLAEAEYDFNDFYNAIADYSNAINLYKNDIDEKKEPQMYASMEIAQKDMIYLKRAKAKSAIKDYSGAIGDCNLIVEVEENNKSWIWEDALKERAKYKAQLNQFFEAIQDYNKLIEKRISTKTYNAPDNYALRGLAKLMLNDNRGAIEDANKAIKLDSTTGWFYFLRGDANYNMENNKEAIRDFNKAIKLDPKDGDSYYNRGLAKIHTGDKNGGCLDFSKAGELGDESAYTLIRKYCGEDHRVSVTTR